VKYIAKDIATTSVRKTAKVITGRENFVSGMKYSTKFERRYSRATTYPGDAIARPLLEYVITNMVAKISTNRKSSNVCFFIIKAPVYEKMQENHTLRYSFLLHFFFNVLPKPIGSLLVRQLRDVQYRFSDRRAADTEYCNPIPSRYGANAPSLVLENNGPFCGFECLQFY
jgi:hypothetical protein